MFCLGPCSRWEPQRYTTLGGSAAFCSTEDEDRPGPVRCNESSSQKPQAGRKVVKHVLVKSLCVNREALASRECCRSFP